MKGLTVEVNNLNTVQNTKQIQKTIRDMKESIMAAVVTIFEQVSFVEETERTKEEAVRMYASVKKYGGFYIARFETGKDENNNNSDQKAPLGFLTQTSGTEITIDLNKVAQEMESEIHKLAENTANENIQNNQAEEAKDENAQTDKDNHTREKFRQMLREGKLEEREVDMMVRRQSQMPNMEIIAGGSIDDLQNSMQGILNMMNGGGREKKRSVTIKEARKILTAEVLDSMVDHDKVADEAKRRVEQSGIIFIDEIDKIATHGGEGDRQAVSREGVQRDILPIVEGSDVNTKWGVVNTTHILFIGAGAFSVSAPSDLIPELQGRFPLRVELEPLKKEDFKRILTEPKNALVKQYEALLATEGVTLKFADEAIDRMSFIAEDVNSHSENIGARRLHTIMETVLEELSFDADRHAGETITIDSKYVDEKLNGVIQNQNLERYIL